jgi:NAD(P)-dependent dehydrogenase (short-subunit alcohol dehydrogenase family)
MDIRNSTVLITGGSRGLGLALGRVLASSGATVVLVARHQAELDQAVARIRAEGGSAFGIIADVGDKNAIHSITGQAVALAGPIDILILNASTLGPVPLRLLLDTECEDLEQVLQVNLVGAFRLAKIVVGSMALRGRGLVIGISSDAAVHGYAGWGAYGVSKAALDHLVRVFASEMEETGVHFLSIDPGEMNTQMHADAMPDADPATLASPDDVAARIFETIRSFERFENGTRLEAL